MTKVSTFSLPRERAAQLRALAYHHSQSIAGLVAAWIERDLRETGISALLPDIGLVVAPNRVVLNASPLLVKFDAATDAWNAAEALHRVAASGGAWVHAGRHDGGMLSITRVGNGVVIELIGRGGDTTRRSFSPDVSFALSRQLRAAAEQALSSH